MSISAASAPADAGRWSVCAAAVAASVVIAALPGAEIQAIFAFALVIGAVKMLFLSRASLPTPILSMAAQRPVATLPATRAAGCAGLAFLDRRASEEAVIDHLLHAGAGLLAAMRGLWQGGGRMATPLAVCLLLAVPALAVLFQMAAGQLSMDGGGYGPVLAVSVILFGTLLLAPVGAELARQFSKRVLEVSLGLFLLLAAGQFAFLMP
ncbi:hypothetical protein ACLBXM_03135 [Xanthobacteraceae bacterium A53D]